MREIFDGYYTKQTGTGKDLVWKGKINFLGGVTEKIYMMDAKYGGMGTRAVNFQMAHSDRKKTTKRAIDNGSNIDVIREEMKKAFSEYINYMVTQIPNLPKEPLDPEIEHSIIEVADFAALARSATERDYKGNLKLTQSSEMPMRIAKQMSGLYDAFRLIGGGKLSQQLEKILYKIGFDSIPMGRRMTLFELAKYGCRSTSKIATGLNYPTATVSEWLEDLNVLGLCSRDRSGENTWTLKEEYRDLIIKHIGIVKEDFTITEVDHLASVLDEME
jgi:hypothetical protein